MTIIISQPEAHKHNPKVTPNRHQAHYEVGKRFGLGRMFTRSEFNQAFHQEYPKRTSPPNPSDYCVNLHQKMTKDFPKFLRWLGRSQYEFIGASIRGESLEIEHRDLLTGDETG